MSEEIYNKLHTALYHISPLASDRDRIIGEMGEVIWLETLEKVLALLDDNKRAQVIALLNTDDVEAVSEMLSETDIDIEKIITDTATDVMNEVTEVK